MPWPSEEGKNNWSRNNESGEILDTGALLCTVVPPTGGACGACSRVNNSYVVIQLERWAISSQSLSTMEA